MVNTIFNIAVWVVYLILISFIAFLLSGAIKSLIANIKDLKGIDKSSTERSDKISEILADVIGIIFCSAILIIFFTAPLVLK